MPNAFDAQLQMLLFKMRPISLDEMKDVRLMKRTDQKYLTDEAHLLRLLAMMAESYYVQEIDGKRIAGYRTVYFDEKNRHTFFRTHLSGRLPRLKVRARSYCETNYNVLEIKRKSNHGKTSKKRIQVGSIKAVVEGHEGADFLKERTGYDFNALMPTVGNRFRRITLVNHAMTERLTIDFGLAFDNFETGRTAAMPNVVIVELKRDGRIPSPIIPMLRQLRIKPSGFSKYCIGFIATHPEVKHNRFKPKMRYVAQIAGADFPMAEPVQKPSTKPL